MAGMTSIPIDSLVITIFYYDAPQNEHTTTSHENELYIYLECLKKKIIVVVIPGVDDMNFLFFWHLLSYGSAAMYLDERI